MSGIAGILHHDGAPVSPGDIAAMTAAQAFRGPDGQQVWREGAAALGHSLLRATPASRYEHQPARSESGRLVIVADTRLDDRDALAAKLVLKTRLAETPDSALILMAYERWGEDAPEHLVGDFAFFIWDRDARRGFAARDRTGAKPFHYSATPKQFRFASDILPLVAGSDATLDDEVLAEHICGAWSLMDRTVWQGVKRLPAGCTMSVSAASVRISRYWRPDAGRRLRYRDDREYEDHYRDLLTGIVQDHAQSIGSIACEASGGLDSSALLALAHTTGTVRGFTLDFAGQGDADELAYVENLEQHTGAPITRIAPTRLTLDEHASRAVAAKSIASVPNGVMGLSVRQAARSTGCRALLVGVGGDEWLHGDRSYYREALEERSWRDVLGYLASDSRTCGAIAPMGWLTRHGAYAMAPEPLRRTVRDRLWRDAGILESEKWLSPAARTRFRASARTQDPVTGQGQVWRALASGHSAQAMDAEERMAAEAGIELRRPYFDARLIEFCLSIPMRQLCRDDVSKSLHRRALKGLLPDSIVNRKSKASFSGLFVELKPMLARRLGRSLPERVERLIDVRRVRARLAIWADTSQPSADDWRVWGLFAAVELARHEVRTGFAAGARSARVSRSVDEPASGF
jgi:asparagine synthase (glutamine-hydrolysing)